MSSREYNAAAIEILTGLEPVRKRPGMYTDVSRPNHLAQEVIDNSVDEVLAGHARTIRVTLRDDGSLEVEDDGRGMPVDIHPEEGIPGVEVILTRLHAGGKFSARSYGYAGGLHGVGVAVVNALSKRLEVSVRRDGQEWQMAFENGTPVSPLEPVAKVGARNTGTRLRFWPDPGFFDTGAFSVSRLRHLLRAKAILAPGLRVTLHDEIRGETEEWHFEGGLDAHLREGLGEADILPDPPFSGSTEAGGAAVDWALAWASDGGEPVAESYVNLVPTVQGGTHVNGLRTGLTEALRAFCELRSLLPRGVRLAPEDVWDGCSYLLSVKLAEPQFSGQTKERLSSREAAAFVSGAVRDCFELWLTQHVESGERIAQRAIAHAERRLRAARRVRRKQVSRGPALPGKLADCALQDVRLTELFLVEGDSAGGSARQARDRQFQAIMPLRGKILNTWEVSPSEVLASQEVHDISVAIGVDPGSADLGGLRYGKIAILADADSDGAHIATLLCALFIRHFRPLVEAGHVYVAMPPLYRIDQGKEVYYALDEEEKRGILARLEADGRRGRIDVQRFKGLGEMNPMQLRETTIAPDTRRLIQLTIEEGDDTEAVLDLLLARRRAADRRTWLETKGDLAQPAV